MRLVIGPSKVQNKKLTAIFYDGDKRIRTINFGQAGASDYTQHKDASRRERYLARHRAREDWDDPMTAGALSRWLLWGDSTNIQTNIREFKKRFGLN